MIRNESKLIILLEKVFWLYLYINPLLDILNGFYINLVNDVDVLDVEFIATLGITPSLLLRLVFLVVCGLYILLIRDRKSISVAALIGVAWALSLVSEYSRIGSIAFFIDAQYMARFCYNIVLLMVFSRIFAKRWRDDGKALLAQLGKLAVYTMTVLAAAILLPAIFGLGYSTYADILGYRGNRGFFYAGNDITAILAILLPMLIAMCMSGKAAGIQNKSAWLFPAFAAALGTNALLIIGSKTAFLALLLSYLVMFCAGLFFAGSGTRRAALIAYLRVLLFAIGLCLLLNLISVIQHLPQIKAQFGGLTWKGIYSCSIFSTVVDSMQATERLLNKHHAAGLLSGRQLKLTEQLAQFRSGGALTWLFGLGRGSQAQVIEMDFFEVLCYYGVFGFVTMLYLYVRLAIGFFKGFFRNVSLTGIAVFLAIGMTVGYLVIAGHVLFSVTSGFYLAFAILFSRVLFAKKAEDILLWRQA